MTNDDETSSPPEFVAVTPRGVVPEPGTPAPQPQPQAEATLPMPATDAAGETESEPAAQSPQAAAPAESPVAAEAEPAEPIAVEPDAEEPPTEAPAVEPGPAGPQATTPTQPDPSPAGDVEVSVRVAAEGMAAALAGEPVHEADGRHSADRSVGPVALATAVCVVLTLAAGTVLGIAARRSSHDRQVAAARATTGTSATSALVAAKAETAAALTYDYRTLEADFQRAEAGMSRKFRANYAETAAKSVTPLAQKTHAVTTGTVAAAGVVSATPTTARILVFADQTVENKLLNATSRLDRSVIEVTMVKQNGRWVIDNLQPF
ncbi:MAG TPA: hypothetical protein VHE56_00255 [Mycobacteriales bacterium]|nr:hypothetical protein [Mycobacteriales bacterium]